VQETIGVMRGEAVNTRAYMLYAGGAWIVDGLVRSAYRPFSTSSSMDENEPTTYRTVSTNVDSAKLFLQET
jgi:hypothetical protein